MLTSRERLRRCFFHEPLDRPGVYCRTGMPAKDPSYDPLRKLLAERTDQKLAVRFASLIEPLPVEQRSEAHSDDWRRDITVLHTPEGDLTRTVLHSLKNQPGMVEKHFLDGRADAEKYLSLPLPTVGGDVSVFFQRDAQIGDRGIVDVSLGMNPAGQVAELFGSETFAILSATDRDIVEALCERQMKIMLLLVDDLVAQGVGPYFSTLGQEYVTPPLHSPRDFFDFNVRYDKPILDRIHEAGGRVHVHCHSSIHTVFEGFVEMGADVLHPFEAPPMGDITPAQAKEMARGRICLEGNIQIADMYEKSPDNIRAQAQALIAACFDDGRDLILCPTASPYIYGGGEQCYAQFQALVDTVHAAGVT